MERPQLTPFTQQGYSAITPEHQGWISHIQHDNPNIPHINPYSSGTRQAKEWDRGWYEAIEDLMADAETAN